MWAAVTVTTGLRLSVISSPRGSRAAFRIGCCVLEIVVKMLATHVIVG